MRGLENAALGLQPWGPRSQFFTIWTNPKPVNKLFIFSKLSNEKKLTEKTHASITVTMVDRKSRTVLRTNQIAGFVTMPDWKKIKHDIFTCEDIMFLHENPPGISNFNFRHS